MVCLAGSPAGSGLHEGWGILGSMEGTALAGVRAHPWHLERCLVLIYSYGH